MRTRLDYVRALNAYRAVYHRDPASPDAGRSIAAVADLLASEGHCSHDAKLFHDAVAQWRFLRKQYPGSPLRQRALLQEAEIEQHDLHDRSAAKKIYRLFLKDYPHDGLAEQARAGLRGDPVAEPKNARPRVADTKPARLQDARPERASSSKSNPVHATAHKKAPSVTEANGSVAGAPGAVATIQSVRHWAEGNSTRLAIDMSAAIPCRVYSSQDRKQITALFFGAQPASALASHAVPVQRAGNIRSIHVSALTGDQTSVVLDLGHPADVSSFQLSGPARWILDLHPMRSPPGPPERSATRTTARRPPRTVAPAPASTQPGLVVHLPAQTSAALSPARTLSAEPTVKTESSMSRVLGLRVRRIVIDAGHGGHDSGTLGPGGIEEKNIALDVALRLGRLLHQRLGADVIYTRRTDKFIPLEERTAIANQAHADLFISIHANSSSDPDVRGVETYYLNFTASPDALAVAARENASSNRSVSELSDLVRKIALSDKIDESRMFAEDVQQSLYDGLAPGNDGLKDRGVKQAPFVVLIGAKMPSILAEISFLSNPEDAEELRRPAYRERIAEDLYRGVAQYVDGRSGVRIANTAKPDALPAPAE